MKGREEGKRERRKEIKGGRRREETTLHPLGEGRGKRMYGRKEKREGVERREERRGERKREREYRYKVPSKERMGERKMEREGEI